MVNKRHLLFNSSAPDLTVKDTQGNEVQLSNFWKNTPLLLAFTRHFGCTQCKEMLEELVNGRDQIERAGLRLVVITQGTPELTAEFGKRYAPGLTLLADPERKAYSAYGLERGNLFQTFLSLNVWKAIRLSRKKGLAVEMPPEGQDAMQMSGTFIINTQGRIELPFYYDDIADHPSLDLLLKGVLNTSWKSSFEGPVGIQENTKKNG